MAFRFRLVPSCLFLVLATSPVAAQDAHYWTDQFGNRARLLSGAVIGNSTDLASVYYNPGALSLVESPELLVSANVYQYTNYSLKTDAVLFENLNQGRIGAAPSLFAGEINFGFLGETRFAYSVLTRYSTDIRLQGALSVSSDDGPVFDDLQKLAGSIDLEEKITETWVGFTFSRAISEHWGVGVSPFVTVRSQRTGRSITAQSQDTAGLAAVLIDATNTKFTNWRLLAKLGASAVYGPWRFGATITTPSLRVFGDGSAYATRTVVVQGGPGVVDALVEQDIPADYRSPLTIGVGGAYEWETSSLNVSLEYFSRIDSAQVMDIGSVVDEVGDTLTVDLVQELNPVLNAAIGFQHTFSDKLEGYAGLRTDFSAKVPGALKSTFPLAGWDIYHLSGGATFDLGQSHFTLGGILGFGGGDATEIAIDPESPPAFSTPAKISYFRATIILGFAIFFN